jgi:hypothetical protein
LAKYTVKAYGEESEGLKTITTTIEADSDREAKKKAWEMFPEYHEVGVWKK